MPQQALKAAAHLAPPPPPLLLTKRVTAFLQANLSTHIHTAALTTPSGRLLAHASHATSSHASSHASHTGPAPARILRRHCAVAASLWAIHGPDSGFGDLADVALPKSCSTTPSSEPMLAKAITVQLAGGVVFIVRALRCGLLFLAVGGGSGGSGGSGSGSGGIGGSGASGGSSGSGSGSGNNSDQFQHLQHQQQQQQQPGTAAPFLPPASEIAGNRVPGGPEHASHVEGNGGGLSAAAAVSSPPLGSPSEAESVLSGGAPSIASQATSVGGSSVGGVSTATVLATRRQAEELARWLDDKLGSLSVPIQGIDSG